MGLYDLFEGSGRTSSSRNSWAENQKLLKEQAYTDVDRCCERIKESGAELSKYLAVQARFNRYTVTNALLVCNSKSNATRLKEKNDWRNEGAYVLGNESPMVILKAGKDYIGRDGKRHTSIVAKEVFDVSQTTIRDRMPESRSYEMGKLVRALIESCPVEFQPIDDLNMPAYYDPAQQVIFVRRGLQETELFHSMSKEAASAVYDLKHGMGRDSCEFQTYCVSYMLGSKYGLNTDNFQFDRSPEEFAGLDSRGVKAKLYSIRDVYCDIQDQMYQNLNRGRDKGNNMPSKDMREAR